MSVDVIVDSGGWDEVDLSQWADRAITATLSYLELNADAFEISLLGCDDPRIAALNADFRAKATPTNVLSWPSAERSNPGGTPDLPNGGELGDIAIAFETCRAEARAANISLCDHTKHLLIHATLHLLGYDHESDADATLMEGLEIAILSGLGLHNPYAD